MSEQRKVALADDGGDVKLEVVVTHQKPAAIAVALYGADRHKERDLGSALTLTPPDPDVFDIAKRGEVGTLQGKILGIFVAISSFDTGGDQPVSVIATLRQGGQTITNGTVVETAVIKSGGAGSIIGYEISVA